MNRTVLDTNVLASGMVTSGGTPERILDRWSEGDFELIVSEHILAELERTMGKPYFRDRSDDKRVREDLIRLREEATVVAVTVEVSGVATHAADDLVLAAAVSAGADYLVTGDHKLQRVGSYRGVTIISPRAFLEWLERTEVEEAVEATD